jgi:hypothetical protein
MWGGWGGRFTEPVFVLTGDQDWVNSRYMNVALNETIGCGVPFHLFVTNQDSALEHPVDGLSLGIHPNCLPGSSHGSSEREVINTCLELVPGATTFRSHSYFEHTRLLGMLRRRGLRADSNLGLFAQPGLVPLLHCTGLLRLPVFFEDDIFFNVAGADLSLNPLRRVLFSPGLKILNFHPALIGANVPSQQFYEANKAKLFGSGGAAGDVAFAGRGVRTLLRELIKDIRDGGGEFASFPSVVDDCLGWLDTHRDESLYDWGRQMSVGDADTND